MWVFTEIGFFSAVRADQLDAKAAPLVSVRARVRQDIDRLAEFIASEMKLPRPEVMELKGRDYPYRVIVSRQTWAEVMMELSERIEYGNFKDHIKKIDGQKRASLYSGVWSRMLHAEIDLGHDPSNVSMFGSMGFRFPETGGAEDLPIGNKGDLRGLFNDEPIPGRRRRRR